MRTAWTSLLLTATLATLAGCAEQQIENPGKTLPGSPSVAETQSTELQRVQFGDLPVPHGFELVTRGNRSASFQGGGVRVAGYRYWGKQPPEEVAAFYRRTMPLETYGWTQVGDHRESDASVLSFKKAGQSCKVSIAEESGATVIQMKVSGPTP